MILNILLQFRVWEFGEKKYGITHHDFKLKATNIYDDVDTNSYGSVTTGLEFWLLLEHITSHHNLIASISMKIRAN